MAVRQLKILIQLIAGFLIINLMSAKYLQIINLTSGILQNYTEWAVD